MCSYSFAKLGVGRFDANLPSNPGHSLNHVAKRSCSTVIEGLGHHTLKFTLITAESGCHISTRRTHTATEGAKKIKKNCFWKFFSTGQHSNTPSNESIIYQKLKGPSRPLEVASATY